jgi:hypothetical protein
VKCYEPAVGKSDFDWNEAPRQNSPGTQIIVKIPFSAYDFFAYLATGFILLAAADYAFDIGWLAKEKLPPAMLLLLIIGGYVAGHVVANVSSFLLEHLFVRRILGSPEETHFSPRAKGFWSYIFPIFNKPLPEETQNRVLARAKTAGIERPGRGLFFHCFAIVKRDKTTMERLNAFLNVYGFCRNACMASLFAAVILLYAGLRHFDRTTGSGIDKNKLEWAVVALLVAVGLFYRYLKFFKHYTEEVYRDYAEPPAAKAESQKSAETDSGSESEETSSE